MKPDRVITRTTIEGINLDPIIGKIRPAKHLQPAAGDDRTQAGSQLFRGLTRTRLGTDSHRQRQNQKYRDGAAVRSLMVHMHALPGTWGALGRHIMKTTNGFVLLDEQTLGILRECGTGR